MIERTVTPVVSDVVDLASPDDLALAVQRDRKRLIGRRVGIGLGAVVQDVVPEDDEALLAAEVHASRIGVAGRARATQQVL